MGARSKIEWTDSTFNPWVGCTKIARPRGAPSACDFCYAEKWAKRSGQVLWGNHPRRRTTEAYWRNPITWNDRADQFQGEHGRRRWLCREVDRIAREHDGRVRVTPEELDERRRRRWIAVGPEVQIAEDDGRAHALTRVSADGREALSPSAPGRGTMTTSPGEARGGGWLARC